MHSGDTGAGEGDDGSEFRPPLPPEDRIWRHPSEVAAVSSTPSDRRGVPTDRRGSRTVTVAALSGLVGASLSLGVLAALGTFDPGTTIVERNVAIQPVTSIDSGADTVAAVAARTTPTIAALRIERAGVTWAASAIVLRSDGYLITTAQVVDDADSIEVHLHGGAIHTATVVGIDPATDIAVLHVDDEGLEPAAIGTAEAVAVGDGAITIGLADTGVWETDLTTGFIRGVDRRLQLPDGTVLHDLILIDVTLHDGVVGGPLLDAGGAVVGITHAFPASEDDEASTLVGGEMLGVATPIDLARRIADQIIEHGHARHVWLGVEGTDVSSAAAGDLGIAGGALVTSVVEASPAATAGLIDGDVIIEVEGESVESMSDLIGALRSRDPGDEITVVVRRGAESVSLRVELAEKDRA